MLNRVIAVVVVSAIAIGCCRNVSAQPPQISGEAPSLFAPLNPANWSVPQLPKVPWKLPSLGSKRLKAPATKPSLWTKVRRGTKSSWQKTKSFLNPFPKKTAKSGPSFFDELFTVKEEPRPIETVGDFLSQPRGF